MNTNIIDKSIRPALMEHLNVDSAVIEYQVQGNGEPVLLIPPGLVIDGLGAPLLAEAELASRYRLIHYHRRGYMGSTPGSEPPAISRQAGDAAALLRGLGVKSAHVVGHSIGAIIAMQLAIDAPGLVHSLALLEPPLRMVPSGQASSAQGVMPMINAYRSGNKRQAVEIFSDNIFGPGWQSIVERAIPGGVEQAMGDIDIFMRDLQAIQEWQPEPRQFATIRQPVLSVLGARSTHPEFVKEVRLLLHAWFPQAEDLDLPTTHLLQMQDPKGMAKGLAEYFSRHSMIQVH